MREFGKIQSSLIKSRKFKALRNDDAARLLYLYFHICPHGNSIGCFEFSPGYALIDLGWSVEDFDRAIKALSEVYLVEWDSASEVVKIVDFLKHTPCTNDKHASGGVKIALSLPECDVKRSIVKDLMADKFAKKNADLIALSKTYESPSEDLSEGYRTTTTTTTTTKTPSDRGSTSSAPARDQKPPSQENDGVGIAEVTPSQQSTPATQDRTPDEDRIRHETVMKVRSLRYVDKASAPNLVKDLVDHGADPRDLMRCAGECSVGNLTIDDFKAKARALLPAEIQSAINTNQEASHAQRAKPVHDPIAAAADAARRRASGT